MKNIVKRNRQLNKVTKGSIIAITASVEYFVADVIDACLNLLEEKGKSTIKPDYILKSLNRDQEMAMLLKGKFIMQGLDNNKKG